MPRSDRIELAHRSNDGLAITLWWSPADNGISLEVRRDETSAVVHVDPHRALDAFYHPFAHDDRRAALTELVA
jgi:hypothetical protein